MGFIEPMYRAVGLTTGTPAIAAAARVTFEGEATTQQPGRIVTNAKERTGALGIGTVDVDKWLIANSQVRNLMPFDALWAAGLCLGTFATTTPAGGTDSRQHLITLDTSQAARLLTRVWETSPDLGSLLFEGVGVTGFEIGVKRDEFDTFKANWVGDGSAETHAEDLSAVAVNDTSEAWLKYGGVSWSTGGTYADGDLSSDTDRSALLREGRAFVNTGAEPVYGFGNADGFADSLRMNDFRKMGLMGFEGTIEPGAATFQDFMTNKTVQCMKLACQGAIIEGAIRYEVRVIFPAAQILSNPPASDRSISLSKLKMEALDNGTDPQVVIVVINKDTTIFGS